MAKIGKHARGHADVNEPNNQQATQMDRAAYEQAYRQAYGQQRPASAQQDHQYHHQPTRQQPQVQRPVAATNAYQPYGQSTADSHLYDQWANAQNGREFDMNRGKKKSGFRKVVITLCVILLVLLLGVGIGAFLYLNHINSIISPGDDREDIEFALSDQQGTKPYYVLLLGSDSREGVIGSDADWAGKEQDGSDGLADVMVLVRIDEVNKQVTLLSIPRDTPWQREDGSWAKLNYAYREGGVSSSIKAVSELAGVPISHVAEIHMSEFMDLVDLVGGITVEVPSRIDYHEALTNEHIIIEEGVQHLNGAEAEVFVRERASLGDSQEMKRQAKVRVVIMAILSEIKEKPAWELPSLLAECASCVTTDLNATDLLAIYSELGSDALVYSGTGPYDGDYNPNVGNEWLCFQDSEGWARVMGVVDSGGDPSTVSYVGDKATVAGA
ncbi:MAG: LCP family protein [Eggerthellaceae bacterium]|nr:LCP family protein [Eggerthellaceae bacterium]